MNKLTPIFISGAIVAVVGLSYAQAQMGNADHGGHAGHDGSAAHMSAELSSESVIRA